MQQKLTQINTFISYKLHSEKLKTKIWEKQREHCGNFFNIKGNKNGEKQTLKNMHIPFKIMEYKFDFLFNTTTGDLFLIR